MPFVTCRAPLFGRVTITIASIVLSGLLAGCEESKDTTPLDQSKMEAADLVADVLFLASRGSNGPHFTWGKRGDTFISTNGEGYTEKVKVTPQAACVYGFEFSIDSGGKVTQRGEYTFDFAKVRKVSNIATKSAVGIPSSNFELEGQVGFACSKNPVDCSRTTFHVRTDRKEYTDRATNSFRELAKRFCPAAGAAQIIATEPPPRKWDGTKVPTTADFQEYWDKKGKPTKVTSSSCVSAGPSEWRCEVVYEVFINNPNQLMLAGYYENTYSAVYGLQNDELRAIRDYRLINQRRI